jgi:ectoine hydroxylase-related dioxygenase (phytanoyl-CoA dioxygenase family)
MAVIESLGPAARGRRLEHVGALRESRATDDLTARLQQDGYLFVRDLLDRELVQAGRAELLDQPELEQTYPMRSDTMKAVVHGPRILAFFSELFGTPARSYDFIWLRHQPPSFGIPPHCDTVFMGRGTPDVLTAWIPFGDIAIRAGGLMLLEDSHRIARERIADYLAQDVDRYCENGPNARAVEAGEMKWEHWRDHTDWNGEITEDPHQLAADWGTRWLTADFRMGDVLIFTLRTVHAGTDNEVDALRLSTDSRYQPANQPIDERWIRGEHGEDPVGHGLAAKQGTIC